MIWTAVAWAQDHGLGVVAAERGLAVGQWNVAVGVEPGVDLVAGEVVPRVALPARIGFTDDLEVYFGPVARTELPHLHDPALGARFRLVDGDVEVAAQAQADLAVFEAPAAATAEVGAPVRLHVASHLALDTGAHLQLGLVPEVVPGVRVPVGLVANATDTVAFTVASGVVVALGDSVGVTLPGEARATWTLASGDDPRLDLGAFAAWPDLTTPDALTAGLAATLLFAR
jgi:hypothetical protein